MKVRQARKILKRYGYDLLLDGFVLDYLKYPIHHSNFTLKKAKLVSNRLLNKQLNKKKYKNIFIRNAQLQSIIILGRINSMLRSEYEN